MSYIKIGTIKGGYIVDGTKLKTGNQFVIKDSRTIGRYHIFKDGETVILAEDIKADSNLAYKFIRESDGLEQHIFLRDVEPL